MSLLTVEQLNHGFGDRTIFEDISFRLNRGEHIGLVGANGEGKSTFMNIVADHLEPNEGSRPYGETYYRKRKIGNQYCRGNGN